MKKLKITNKLKDKSEQNNSDLMHNLTREMIDEQGSIIEKQMKAFLKKNNLPENPEKLQALGFAINLITMPLSAFHSEYRFELYKIVDTQKFGIKNTIKVV